MKITRAISGWIEALIWENNVLEVWLRKGDVYEYYGVSKDTYLALFSNGPCGKNFNKLIKGQYIYHQLL